MALFDRCAKVLNTGVQQVFGNPLRIPDGHGGQTVVRGVLTEDVEFMLDYQQAPVKVATIEAHRQDILHLKPGDVLQVVGGRDWVYDQRVSDDGHFIVVIVK
ncbi:MAG: hypothetical protein CME61_08635 [Halobacteriovoraceae bacterium]|nr:hypothetical protein [Halobacteriovoraceae bacterium]OUX68059.1 MAG: hypothetical protein CBD38_00385 [bacterium TMED178]|tara:strand:+ start:81 stop:386 length:306 start_codon:yes stop_codon:yes gene_type:complete